MDRSEKIVGMLMLLELNDDQFCYEMTSLGNKINNFFDDQSRLISAQWLSVMFRSLTGEDDSEIVDNKPVDINVYETEDICANQTIRTDANNFIDESSLIVNESNFTLVGELVNV